MLRRTFLFGSVSAAVVHANGQANAKGESLVHRSTIRSAALQPESLVYVPADYKKNMPLLVWLHGASLRGSDVQMVKRYAHLSESQSAKIVTTMNAELFGEA